MVLFFQFKLKMAVDAALTKKKVCEVKDFKCFFKKIFHSVFSRRISTFPCKCRTILGPKLFLLYLNDLLDVICNIAISKCDQASDRWQQLELASELESDLRDTVDWGRKWLVDFNAGKTQLVLYDQSNNTGAIDVRMDGSVLEEKSCWG